MDSWKWERESSFKKDFINFFLTWLVWEIQTPYKNFDQKLSSLGNKSLGKNFTEPILYTQF